MGGGQDEEEQRWLPLKKMGEINRRKGLKYKEKFLMNEFENKKRKKQEFFKIFFPEM